jgi:ribosomal protein L37E
MPSPPRPSIPPDDWERPPGSEGGRRPSRAIRRAPAAGDVVPARQRPQREEIDEGPSEEDLARLDSPTRTCPECGREVFDDSEVCYHCGHHFSAGERSVPWLQLGVALVIVLVFVGIYILRLF